MAIVATYSYQSALIRTHARIVFQILSFDSHMGVVVAESGVILANLNKYTEPHFAPKLATQRTA